MMRKISVLFLLIFVLLNCSKGVKDTPDQNQTFSSSTEYSKKSADKIDQAPTYEINFTIEKPVNCITVDIESVYLQKSFPMQKIPKKTYFIVEKKFSIPLSKTKTMDRYTAIGRNFNNDWELYSPVKICTSKDDPLSILDTSEYRIRFTAFDERDLYFIVTITSEVKIIFHGGEIPGN